MANVDWTDYAEEMEEFLGRVIEGDWGQLVSLEGFISFFNNKVAGPLGTVSPRIQEIMEELRMEKLQVLIDEGIAAAVRISNGRTVGFFRDIETGRFVGRDTIDRLLNNIRF